MNKRASLEDAIHHAKNRVYEKTKLLLNDDTSPNHWSHKDHQIRQQIVNTLLTYGTLLKLPDDQVTTLHQLQSNGFWFGDADDFWHIHIRGEGESWDLIHQS